MGIINKFEKVVHKNGNNEEQSGQETNYAADHHYESHPPQQQPQGFSPSHNESPHHKLGGIGTHLKHHKAPGSGNVHDEPHLGPAQQMGQLPPPCGPEKLAEQHIDKGHPGHKAAMQNASAQHGGTGGAGMGSGHANEGGGKLATERGQGEPEGDTRM